MDVSVGSTVTFDSPTQNAILKGYIVDKAEMQDMYPDYHQNQQYGYEADTVFYRIRVYEVVELTTTKDKYNPPLLCKVPSMKLRTIVEENSAFHSEKRPQEQITQNTLRD